MAKDNPVIDPLLKAHLDSISYFLGAYDMEETEIIMWDLLLYTFTCEEADNWDSSRRNNTLHFYKLLLDLIKGVIGIAVPMFHHFQHELPYNLKHIKINNNE